LDSVPVPVQVIGKTRLGNDLYCANEAVKHYSLFHSTTASTWYQIQVDVKCLSLQRRYVSISRRLSLEQRERLGGGRIAGRLRWCYGYWQLLKPTTKLYTRRSDGGRMH